MPRVTARGFRLSNADQYDLQWLHCQADAQIAGLAGQGYEPRASGDTSPDKLFLQERLVGWGNEEIARQTRLREIARRMVAEDPNAGWSHWDWLRRVYGPLVLRDPHDHFGRELAPLARLTPAALRRAEQRWPHWHVLKHEASYERLYRRLHGELGGSAAIERMMRLMPDDAHKAGEAEEVMSDVLDGACLRFKECLKYNQRVSPADEKLLRDAERQADEMLATAGTAFQEASIKVDEEAEETGRKRRAREDRERAVQVRSEVRSISDVLEIDQKQLARWFWEKDSDEDAAQ